MSDFDKNVFINCPFDDNYRPLLKVLLFAVKICGMQPRIASERFNSGEVRLSKIRQLIESSKFGIHDLSRIRARKANEYFRLNMPLELGLDLGCRDYHPDEKYRSKTFLILEAERYSVQKALSDLSFADCKCHHNKEDTLIECVRHWFYENGIKTLPSGSSIWNGYIEFTSYLYVLKTEQGFNPKEIDNILVPEYLDWIDESLVQKKGVGS